MSRSVGRISSYLKSLNWQSIITMSLIVFYLTNFGFRVLSYRFPDYGQDFLAFWSAGKVADQEGYARIYDAQSLRAVEGREMIDLGMLDQADDPSFLVLPAPYFAVFILPFQFLSRLQIQTSLNIWLVFNFLLLVGYLLFFTASLNKNDPSNFSPFLLVLFSYPVFDNFLEAQLNVFLMVCVGEFIRNSDKNRSVIAGLWLGGLLLKPQLLVLVVPLLFFLKYWKPLIGFLASSAMLLLVSWMLTGTAGMKALFGILTGFTSQMDIVSPQYMINWRMLGVNLNLWTHSSMGWIVVALGMAATLIAVVWMARKKPEYGGPAWRMLLLGVFAATLAFTWHAHNHMAMIIIPALLAASFSGGLSLKNLRIWSLVPPLAWLAAGLVTVILQKVSNIQTINLVGPAIAFSAFLVNLWILAVVVRREVFARATTGDEL